eukprot:TCONS_00035515-protein
MIMKKTSLSPLFSLPYSFFNLAFHHSRLPKMLIDFSLTMKTYSKSFRYSFIHVFSLKEARKIPDFGTFFPSFPRTWSNHRANANKTLFKRTLSIVCFESKRTLYVLSLRLFSLEISFQRRMTF